MTSYLLGGSFQITEYVYSKNVAFTTFENISTVGYISKG